MSSRTSRKCFSAQLTKQEKFYHKKINQEKEIKIKKYLKKKLKKK